MSDQHERPEDISPPEWARLRALPSEADRLRAQGWGGDPDPEEGEQVALHVPVPDDDDRRWLLARFLRDVARRVEAGSGPRHPVAASLDALAAGVREGRAVLPWMARPDREATYAVLLAAWQRARAECLEAEPDLRRVVQAFEAAGWAPPPDPTTARRLERALCHSGPLDT